MIGDGDLGRELGVREGELAVGDGVAKVDDSRRLRWL
jgi:hypothetical protein